MAASDDVATVREGDEQPAPSDDMPTRLGHFEIVGRLGEGGMGKVYQGRDSVLGRPVALKLLHSSTASGVAPARLLREAQALAKLSHPNVVTVFEVGMAGDDRFIAMELVEGTTLVEWMARPRDWRAVLDVFIAVGHGLAAVHDLGLVHRDFKPSNVLVDTRGTPKLGDFGLVGASEEPRGSAATISDDNTLTTPGVVMGTPAYMAPEQRTGERVDERADQYSFAKSLREALGDKMPAALAPILARAQAVMPDERYPDMEALLADLARVRRGNARRWVAGGIAVVVIAAIVVAWSAGRARSAAATEPCARPTERALAVWSPARSSAIDAHLSKIDPVYGHQRFQLVAPVLDRGAERWQDLHVDTCRANRQGVESDSLLDRRMTCLDRALYELDQTASVLERATDAKTLDRATRAASELPTLAACADTTAVADKLPPPTDPLKRAEVETLTKEIIDIDVTLRARGTRADVVARARAAVDKARALGQPETLAAALRLLAATEHENANWDAEIVALGDGIIAAAGAADDRMLVDLWSKRLSALVWNAKSKDALTLLPAAEAANARTTAPLELRAKFVDAKGLVLAGNHKSADGRAVLDPMIAELTKAGLVAEALALRSTRGHTFGMEQDFASGEAEWRAMIPQAEAVYGRDHPLVGDIHNQIGTMLNFQRKFDESLAELNEALRMEEARLEESPALAHLIFAIGSTYMQLDQVDKAKPFIERSVAMARKTLPPGDIRLADYVGLQATLGDYKDARAGFLEAIAIREKGTRPHIVVANFLYNVAQLDQEQKHHEDALEFGARALAEYEGLPNPDGNSIARALALMAKSQIALKRYPEALAGTERALKEAQHPLVHEVAKYWHGTARIKSGDRGGAVELAEARAALKMPPGEEL